MLPIKIYIEGLNSYAEPVEIDFTRFYRNRIFGIFGDTGAGKSTILDAIILSIYGKTPRLGSNIREAINPRKQEMCLKFQFSIAGDKYLIERNIGKQNKIKLYRVEHDNLVPLAEKEREFREKIRDIIGLSEDEFCKVVILPQNQFAEILKLEPAKRAELIGNLFDLNVFGAPLYDVVVSKLSELKASKEEREKRLKELESITEQSIESKEKELKQVHNNLEKLQKEQKTLSEKLKIFQSFIQLNDRKKALEREITEIIKKTSKIEKLKERLKIDEELSLYKGFYDEWLRVEKSIAEGESQKSSFDETLKELDIKLERKRNEKEDFEAHYNKKQPELIKKLAELEQLIEINKSLRQQEENQQKINDEITTLKKNKTKIEREIEKTKSEIDKHWKEIELHKKDLKQHELSKEEESLYKTLQSNLHQIKRLEDLQKEIQNIDKKINKEIKEFDEIFEKLKKLLQLKIALKVKTYDEIENRLIEEINRLRTEKEQKEAELKELEIKNLAATLSKKLSPGMPCPVCGSKEHPSPAKTPLDKEINKIEMEITALEEMLKNSENLHNEIRGDLNKLNSKKTKIEEFKTQLEEKTNQTKVLEEELSNKISPEYWKKAEDTFLKLKEKSDKYGAILKRLTELNNIFTEKNSSLNEKNNELAKINAEIDAQTKRLEELTKQIDEQRINLFEKTQGRQPEEIKTETEKELETLKKKREQIEKTLKELEENKNKLSLKLQAINTSLEKDKKRKEELFTALSEKAVEKGVKVDELKQFFIEEKERAKIKKEIDEFENTFKTKKGEYEGIVKQLEVLPIKSLPPDEPSKTETFLNEMNKKIAESNQRIGALNEQIEKEKQQLIEKQELTKEMEEINKKFLYTELLKKLTTGKEMVKFLSWYLLKDIVVVTNELLKELIGKRFLVNVLPNLEFTITDLLYNKERPVATLSGGETFILSFALALSLSHYIQSRRKKSIEFFFIDEGFSSLDRDLLDSLCNVLDRLRSQDRLVGLISHLDDLKQIIPEYINVYRDRIGSSKVAIV